MKRALLICLIVAGCKQGDGERCQVNDDCQAPLVCNKAKNTCQNESGGGLDASVPDGPKPDAAIDAGSGSAAGDTESF